MGEQAEAALRASFRALRIVEINYADHHIGTGYCPCCDLIWRDGHAPDCELALALAAIRDLLPDVEEG